METDLQLVLLLIGILIMGGVVFDAIRRKKNKDQREIKDFENTILQSNPSSAHVTPSSSEETDPLLDDIQVPTSSKVNQVDSTLEKAPKASNAPQAALSETIHPQELIVMTILPRNQRGFSGRALLSVLKGNQFHFGDKEIFHCYSEQEGKSKILFSLASIKEPGAFDLDQIPNQFFPGLCVFMVLSQVEQPLATFEKMLNVARQMAGTLAGEVCDGKRSNLTIQTIEHFREKIREYTRKRLASQNLSELQ